MKCNPENYLKRYYLLFIDEERRPRLGNLLLDAQLVNDRPEI